MRMVWVRNIGMRPAYVCDSCGLCYRDAKAAIECEAFCGKFRACSLDITKKAMKDQ